MTARSIRTSETKEHDPRLLQQKEGHQIELEQQNEALKRAQEALAKARDKYRELYAEYRDLYDSAPIGYLTLTGKGEIAALNTIACRILGGSHNGLIGASLYRFLPLPDKGALFAFVTSKQHGIGLGLAIVKQIVSAHEGLITYKSTPQGTEFRVMLPRQERQDVPGA